MSKARLYFDIFHHAVRDRDSQSIPLRRDIHKHPMSRSIPQTQTRPLRLYHPSDDLFVSVESCRSVCKNVPFLCSWRFHSIYLHRGLRIFSRRVSLFFWQTEKYHKRVEVTKTRKREKARTSFLDINFTLIIFVTMYTRVYTVIKREYWICSILRTNSRLHNSRVN